MLRRTWLARSRTQLRRTRLRAGSKPKPASPLHPNKRYPLSPHEYHILKCRVFERSHGFCEMQRKGKRCWAPIFWHSWQPHHVIPRSKGGPDKLENMLASCGGCHDKHHGVPQWTRRTA